ncbi:hypothetical protein [Cribrihabitans pelagius]|uniref:hypothetical protein n=1 Tax=Cribrihabitans pelagius TaxID=1765746 RepID=UPI003B5BBE51
MEGCWDSVEITMRTAVLNVSPETRESDAEAAPATETEEQAAAEDAGTGACLSPARPSPLACSQRAQ